MDEVFIPYTKSSSVIIKDKFPSANSITRVKNLFTGKGHFDLSSILGSSDKEYL